MGNLNILIVDDHQTMIDGYVSILNRTVHKIVFECAINCEQAEKHISGSKLFDLIVLDRALPAFGKYLTGEDLAVLAKQKMPSARIMILTSHAEAFVLYNIVQKINPAALLVKSDFNGAELITAVEKVLNGGTYRSSTVQILLKNITSRDGYLDHYNRQIILLLSQGIKTKNLSDHLHLSASAIDKRKVYIKDFFNIEKGSDEDILREARKAGFI
jgi:DNA-binding NarL/FixJ family response regulator